MGKKTPFKSKQSLKPGEVRKNVDLPKSILEILVGEAKSGRGQVKPYMEKILIDHAKKIKTDDALDVAVAKSRAREDNIPFEEVKQGLKSKGK